eukprot:3455098-Amphidinium_carterae.1
MLWHRNGEPQMGNASWSRCSHAHAINLNDVFALAHCWLSSKEADAFLQPLLNMGTASELVTA